MNPVTFKQSNLYTVTGYVQAVTAAPDPGVQADQIAAITTTMPALKQAVVDAEAIHAAAEDALKQAYKPKTSAKQEEVKLAQKEWDDKYSRQARRETRSIFFDKPVDTDAERAAADRLAEAKRELAEIEKAFQRDRPSRGPVDLTRGELHRAETLLRTLQLETEQAALAIEGAKAKLPDGAADLTLAELAKVAAFTPENSGLSEDDLGFSWPDGSPAELAGMIRGELHLDCDCQEGYIFAPVAGVPAARVLLDNGIGGPDNDYDSGYGNEHYWGPPHHPVCNDRACFDPSVLDGILPPRHANHRVHSLKPWPHSPIDEEAQRKQIAKIPSHQEDLQGWIMLGPPGSSKSTYAAASITDMLTFRAAEYPRAPCPNYWRVSVPSWTREMEAWEHRDFGDNEVPEPVPNSSMINDWTHKSGLTPILLLEELDKFTPTPNRLRFLYNLINGVYDQNGTIVSTSNLRKDDLAKHLGEALFRRLSGVNDDPEKFIKCDFWSLPKKGKSK